MAVEKIHALTSKREMVCTFYSYSVKNFENSRNRPSTSPRARHRIGLSSTSPRSAHLQPLPPLSNSRLPISFQHSSCITTTHPPRPFQNVMSVVRAYLGIFAAGSLARRGPWSMFHVTCCCVCRVPQPTTSASQHPTNQLCTNAVQTTKRQSLTFVMNCDVPFMHAT